MEREVIWRIAPHIVWPLRFVLPHDRAQRPAWLLRAGLFLYDHLGGRQLLPPTRTLRLRQDPAGIPLKPAFTLGFEYSDCWVEDSRMVVLNARDAADRGATIATRTRCVSAARTDGAWTLSLADAVTAQATQIRAGAVVNAAGPWVQQVLTSVLRANNPAAVRLVQGSHIVVPKLYDHDRCYIFQNADGRIVFAIPYETDFTLVGTTDQDFQGDPAAVAASAEEVAYLCAAASEYFVRPVTTDMVVWSYSGVRPLYDDGVSAAHAATREYVLVLDAPEGEPALLSVFGGKITTYRRLAEAVLRRLAPHVPQRPGLPPGWTASHALPGGDFPVDGYPAEVTRLRARAPFLPERLARRLVRAYGARAHVVVGDAASLEAMGGGLGADLTHAELAYLMREEWAETAEDVVWRRSKLGLRMTPAEIALVAEAMVRLQAAKLA